MRAGEHGGQVYIPLEREPESATVQNKYWVGRGLLPGEGDVPEPGDLVAVTAWVSRKNFAFRSFAAISCHFGWGPDARPRSGRGQTFVGITVGAFWLIGRVLYFADITGQIRATFCFLRGAGRLGRPQGA